MDCKSFSRLRLYILLLLIISRLRKIRFFSDHCQCAMSAVVDAVMYVYHLVYVVGDMLMLIFVNVNICNALEFPKEQKCGYLLWSIEAKMVQVCFELRSE